MIRFADAASAMLLELPDDVAKYMRHQTSRAKAKETGGILIGHYSADLSLATVLRATGAPSDSRSGSTWFTRGIAGLDDMLRRAWRADQHYLGEWHYHPGGLPEASPSDRAQMHKIASDPKMHCATPLLLVLGDFGDDPRIAAYAQRDSVFQRLAAMSDAEEAAVHPSGRGLGSRTDS
jgi:proteasome lid subunit RPN8/RPN11